MVNQKTICKFKPELKMKKLVFTALAVVAFSATSFAETREVKVDEILFTECEDWAMDQMALQDPGDQLPPEEAHDNYRSLVENCDRNT
jgi:hypothetical protein